MKSRFDPVHFQMTAELIAKGKTLWQYLDELYSQHGMYLNRQVSIALSPEMADIGNRLRQHPPKKIAGIDVTAIDDIKQGVRITNKGEQALSLPSSDVLMYHLADQSRVVVRPSGTEPKLKCYYQVVQSMHDEIDAQAKGEQRLQQLIAHHQQDLLS